MAEIILSDGYVVTKGKPKKKPALPPPYPVTFFPILEGGLAIIPFPENPLTLRNAAPTKVITLVTATEGAAWVGKVAEAYDIPWVNYPFHYSGGVPDTADMRIMRAAVEEAVTEVKSGGKVLLHCLEGIHRSGVIALATMLSVGLDPTQALLNLYCIRRPSYWRLPIDAIILAQELTGKTFPWATLNTWGKED